VGVRGKPVERAGLRAAVNAWLEEVSFRTGLIAATTALVVVAVAGTTGVLVAMLGHGGPTGSAASAFVGASSNPSATASTPAATPSGTSATGQPTSAPTKPATASRDAVDQSTAGGQPPASAVPASASGPASGSAPTDGSTPATSATASGSGPANGGQGGFRQSGGDGHTWRFGFSHRHPGRGMRGGRGRGWHR
jgi:hypothetical protein